MKLKISKMSGIKKRIIKNLIRLFVKINNYSYEKISKYSVMLEGGLHPKHRLIKYYDFFLQNIDEDDSVLDIGCGNGFVAYKLAGKAKSVTGIDIDRDNIEIALKNYKQNNVKFIIGDATKYNFNEKFQVVILSNVLEHIKDRSLFLQKISNNVDKILVRVPTIERGWLDLYKKELGLEYRLDRTHYIEYTRENFVDEIKSSGLKVVRMEVNFGEIWAIVSK